MEKIGRPGMEEEGANVEIGEPVLTRELEKESVEATLPVVKEALQEFYRRRGSREQQAVFAPQAMRNPERVYNLAAAELLKEKGDATLALAILESVRGELQYVRDFIEAKELESEAPSENQPLEEARQHNIEAEMHYQETADIIFSYAEYLVPTRADFIDWLGETKAMIKKMAKEEEEKYRGTEEGEGIGKRIFRSRLLSDVPAIERFESGAEVTRDYRQVMDVVENRLLAYREYIGALLLHYADDPKAEFEHEMAKSLNEARRLELFLAMLEGERNERIAKRQP